MHNTLHFLLFIIVWLPASLQAQWTIVSGNIVDDSTGNPVPYATLQIEGYSHGAVSNANGAFELKYPDELRQHAVLKCASLGYGNQRISLKAIPAGSNIELRMKPQTFTLNEVPIYATDLTAKQMMKKALRKVGKNYVSNPYMLNAFYRHYCKENDVYGRLIEAAVDVYHPNGYGNRARKSPGPQQVRVNQLRRSLDFTQSAANHVPILINQMLNYDVANFLLYITENGKTIFEYDGTSFYDNKSVFIIKATNDSRSGRARRGGMNYRREGKFFISAEDYSIVRYTYAAGVKSKGSNSTNYGLTGMVSYRPYQGKYIVNHILYETENRRLIKDSSGTVKNYKHTAHVEFMVGNVKTAGFRPFKGKEPGYAELNALSFDSGFWRNYNVLKSTPLEMQIEEDLSSIIALDKQFKGYESMGLDQIDMLETRRFNQFLNQNEGAVRLVYVWQSDKLPSIKEVLLARKLAKRWSNKDLRVALISFDKDRDEWRKTLTKRKLSALPGNFWVAKGPSSRLAKHYDIESVPHYLIFDQKGDIVFNGPKLPKFKELETMVEDLLGE